MVDYTIEPWPLTELRPAVRYERQWVSNPARPSAAIAGDVPLA